VTTASEHTVPFPSQNSTTTFVQGGGDELFQAIQDPVIVTTPEGMILEANLAALNAAKKTRKEVVGRGICEIMHGGKWPHIQCPLEEFLLTCQPQVQETRLPGFGGEYLLTISPVKEPDGGVSKILLVARELTLDEIQKVERMRTAQLVAIGELAAGVAHEVNNPINGIINFAQLLLDDGDFTDIQEELLGRIVKEGERIAAIIHNLLSFARESANETEVVDLKAVVQESISLLQHQLNMDSIAITHECQMGRCEIVGNFRQIQQVILNIVSNARYALNERFTGTDEGKKIHFQCGEIEREGKKWVKLIIRDHGTGIPQGILERLFDPFFTTKPAGKGTGLGLSISYGIIKDHGGTIQANSVLNRFTEMIIEMPAYSKRKTSQS